MKILKIAVRYQKTGKRKNKKFVASYLQFIKAYSLVKV